MKMTLGTIRSMSDDELDLKVAQIQDTLNKEDEELLDVMMDEQIERMSN